MILPFRPPSRSTPPFRRSRRAPRRQTACSATPPRPSMGSARRPPCPRSRARAAQGPADRQAVPAAGLGSRDGGGLGPRVHRVRPARCPTRSGPDRSRWCCAAAKGSCRMRCGAVRAGSPCATRPTGASSGWWRQERSAAHLHLGQPAGWPAGAGPGQARRNCSGPRSTPVCCWCSMAACSATCRRRRWSTAPTPCLAWYAKARSRALSCDAPPGGSRRELCFCHEHPRPVRLHRQHLPEPDGRGSAARGARRAGPRSGDGRFRRHRRLGRRAGLRGRLSRRARERARSEQPPRPAAHARPRRVPAISSSSCRGTIWRASPSSAARTRRTCSAPTPGGTTAEPR